MLETTEGIVLRNKETPLKILMKIVNVANYSASFDVLKKRDMDNRSKAIILVFNDSGHIKKKIIEIIKRTFYRNVIIL